MTSLEPNVAEFYTAPNEIDIENLGSDSRSLLDALTTRLARGERTLLPASFNSQTRWYGFAASDRDLRRLLEELSGWLGPPLCDRPIVLHNPEDEIDSRALRLLANRAAVRVDINSQWRREARKNVRSLVDIWSLTPTRPTGSLRHVGRVLREFYESLAVGDRVTAASLLDEIRSGGLLSPTNVRFLRVELLGRLGSPEELRDDPLLAEVALLRRPPAVTDHLARAADRLFIPEGAEALGVDDWADLATLIESTWPGLIQHPSQVRSVAGARCLALAEHAADAPRQSTIDALRSDWSEDPLVRSVVEAFDQTLGSDGTEDSRSQGPEAVLDHFRCGDFERVLDAAAAEEEVNNGVAVAAMHAALNLGDARSAATALEIVDRLCADDKRALLAQTVEGTFYTQLLERNQGERIPDGWMEWLVDEWPDRPDLLAEWCSAWDSGQISDWRLADELAVELLGALNDDRRGRVRNGLPTFVEWMVGDEGLSPSGVALAVLTVEVLLGSDPGRAERRIALDLVGEILATGCSADQYRELMASLRAQYQVLGPREVGWLVSMLDLIFVSSAPDESVRLQLASEALGLGKAWMGRVDLTELRLLARILEDAGLVLEVGDVRSDASEPAPRRPLHCIGIYSLSETAARNATRWIQEEWPDATIEFSSAHQNNQELQGLAGRSDVVLMQTSHAKHAATQALERAVDETRLVRVNGRGATSIYRCLLDWAGQQ